MTIYGYMQKSFNIFHALLETENQRIQSSFLQMAQVSSLVDKWTQTYHDLAKSKKHVVFI